MSRLRFLGSQCEGTPDFVNSLPALLHITGVDVRFKREGRRSVLDLATKQAYGWCRPFPGFYVRVQWTDALNVEKVRVPSVPASPG